PSTRPAECLTSLCRQKLCPLRQGTKPVGCCLAQQKTRTRLPRRVGTQPRRLPALLHPAGRGPCRLPPVSRVAPPLLLLPQFRFHTNLLFAKPTLCKIP